MINNIEVLRGAVARGWCSPENAGKEVDPVLAEAIVQEVIAALAAMGGQEGNSYWPKPTDKGGADWTGYD